MRQFCGKAERIASDGFTKRILQQVQEYDLPPTDTQEIFYIQEIKKLSQ